MVGGMGITVARRLERPSWLNLRSILGAILFAIAFVAGNAVLMQAEDGHLVWVARRDLPSGSVLTGSELTLAAVDMAPSQLEQYLGRRADLHEAILVRPVRRGELLHASAVAAGGAGVSTRALTIPLDAAHAVGGALRVGDKVDVFATTSSGQREARTSLLVADVEVQDVLSEASFVTEDGALVGITVAVTPEDAARLAFAIRNAELDVVRVDGPASDVNVSSVEAEDLR